LYANRGLKFEGIIEQQLAKSERAGEGLIRKVATPWKIQRDPKTGEVNKAFPEKKSTVDYIGIFNNKPVAFECKSTKNKTSFPLHNIKDHQIDFLRKWREFNGVSFILVYFETLNKTFVLSLDQYDKFLNDYDRKSIPLHFFEDHCITIKNFDFTWII
jgi:recombination protein U